MKKNVNEIKSYLKKIILEDDSVKKYFSWKQLPHSSIDNVIDKYFEENNVDDMSDFAGVVVKMIQKINILVDIETCVANRALNYIGQFYDAQKAKELKAILEKDYKIFVTQQDEDENGPAATGAGPEIA